jgi:hypothetical protein
LTPPPSRGGPRPDRRGLAQAQGPPAGRGGTLARGARSRTRPGARHHHRPGCRRPVPPRWLRLPGSRATRKPL